jgi:hypothetical protein
LLALKFWGTCIGGAFGSGFNLRELEVFLCLAFSIIRFFLEKAHSELTECVAQTISVNTHIVRRLKRSNDNNCVVVFAVFTITNVIEPVQCSIFFAFLE